MKVSVEIDLTPTKREVYNFNIFVTTLVFTSYHIEEKPAGKRKWNITGFWDTYNLRQSNLTEPVLPEAIKEKAKEKLIASIFVKTWGEYQK